jgi:hypothetical protein
MDKEGGSLSGRRCSTSHTQGGTTPYFEKPTSKRGDVIIVDFRDSIGGIQWCLGIESLLFPRGCNFVVDAGH